MPSHKETRARAIALFMAGSLTFAGCSGDNEEPSADYPEAREAYEQSATQRTSDTAVPIAAAYVERLASSPPDDAFYKQFEGRISALTDFLCSGIRDLPGKAGSGEAKAQRLDDLRVNTEDIVRDGFIGALLTKALAAPAGERDRLLNTLGVKATGVDGAEVDGTGALEAIGLLDGQGRVTIPDRSTDQYTRYERWLTEQARGFAGISSKLMGNAKAEIDRCST